MSILVRRSIGLLCLGLVALMLIGVAPGPRQEAAGDAVTVCASGFDFDTIQAAIDDAGTGAGTVIRIMDAVHTEAGVLVNKDVVIEGQGAENTIVQGAENVDVAPDRVFFVARGADVLIREMTIRHGGPRGEPRSGGGIRNEGTLRVEDCVIRDNQAGAGAGIMNDGTLTVVRCAIIDNGAIGGDLFVECNTGGGIKSLEGPVTLIDSTVSGNTSIKKGGGIHIACKGMLVMVNSTVSGNSTNGDGGGISLDGVGWLINSTIAFNSAHNAGGVHVNGTAEGLGRGVLHYTGTVIAGNTITFGDHGVTDCLIGDYASIGGNAYNLVGDGSCEAAFAGDPLLASLGDNGGATETHVPSLASPLVDVIPAEECAVDTDQRGVSRPYSLGCDIGALELEEDAGDILLYMVGGGLLVLLVIGGLLYARPGRRNAAQGNGS